MKRYFITLFLVFWSFLWLYANSGRQIWFIENKGQWPSEVLFKASIPGGDLYILKNKLKYVFYPEMHGGHHGAFDTDHAVARAGSEPQKSSFFHAVELSFEGASADAGVKGLDAVPTRLNYFKGKDPRKWASGVRAFAKVKIENLYEGIDMILYSGPSVLKYDIEVAPGVDAAQIAIKYSGQSELRVQEGRLVIGTVHGHFYEDKPYCYIHDKNGKFPVESSFVVDEGLVKFSFPSGYDQSSKLVIDPELIFSTYSGSHADNWGFTATYDASGNLYSGGIVFDTGFPVTNGVFQPDHAGEWDVGILKYDSTGRKLLWATYLGGSFSETPQSIIENSRGELVIYGTTSSPDFPITSNAWGGTFAGGVPIYDTLGNSNPRLVGGIPFKNGSDVFLAVLSKNGQNLMGSTFVGGSGNDGIMERFKPLTKNYGDQFRGEVILDEEDNIYVASNTSSWDFPIKNGPQTNYGGNTNDGVVMAFNTDLSELLWSTYLGGSGTDAMYSIKVDKNGDVVVSGGSNSPDFPVTPGTIKTSKPSREDIDGVVVKLTNAGDSIIAATFIGTEDYDQAYFVDLDSSGHIYLLGQTQGAFPVTAGVYSNPGSGQFIQKLGTALDTIFYSTVVGTGAGSPDISPTAFLVNECENILLSGWGGVLNHPGFGYIGGSTIGLPITENAYQKETDGTDFYLMVLLQDAQQLLYATYFGENGGRGEHVDGGTSRFDKRGIVYQAVCGGCGGSSGFPTWPPDVWSTTNNSSNCNNAAFKFDLASLLARFDTDTEDFTDRGVREGCYPLTLVFLNESIGGEDFLWEFGEGTVTDQEDSILITYENPGIYPVVLTATDINTCVRVSRAYGNITVHDYAFSIMPDDSICEGEQITLWAKGGVQYEWKPEYHLQNPGAATPLASPDTTIIYKVKIEDANGCKAEDSVLIKVIPEITADFEIDKGYDCFDMPVVKFINKSENAGLYLWDFGDGQTSEDFEPEHRYEEQDTFKVVLTAKESMCSTSKQMTVSSVKPFIPNVFSPNDDGINDTFEISADGIIELKVFNRWGRPVYESKDYRNTWNGGDLAAGVYFYEVIFNDRKTRCNGWVQVLR